MWDAEQASPTQKLCNEGHLEERRTLIYSCMLVQGLPAQDFALWGRSDDVSRPADFLGGHKWKE